MRLVDADELKKRLQSMVTHELTSNRRKDAESFAMTIFALDKIPTAMGWISAEDRLPEREGLYLCWTVFNGEACYQIHLWKDGRWYWVHDVRYWMPLPEPPEEVRDDA